MSSFAPSTILIIGATGFIGKYITNAILDAAPAFQKVIVITSEASASSKKELLSSWQVKGVQVITGDITKEADITAAYTGVDTVISCLGRGGLEHQFKLIDLAEATDNIKWFFPSEYGTDIEYSAESAHEKPHQVKLRIRKHIRENVKRIKYTYLVTGPYAEAWFRLADSSPEAGGFDVAKRKAVVIDDGDGRVGLTTMPE